MQLLDLTLPSSAENLALDEALLEMPSLGEGVLRLWEASDYSVVLGRSSRIEQEVDRQACAAASIPILRRVSGGATIVTGPGCLMYAVVAPASVMAAGQSEESLREESYLAIDAVHRYVQQRMVTALHPIARQVTHAGTSDLAILPSRKGATSGPLQKFSGNSVRVKRDRFLYHGTLLYDFNLPLIPKLLRTAPRQPDYRQQRDHESFVANLEVDRQSLVDALITGWDAEQLMTNYPADEVARLVNEKYRHDHWNFQR